MSDTPIFDKLAAARGFNRMVDREPNGKTSRGLGFFVEAVSESQKPYKPDPYLDGPLHLIGAQEATEVPLDEEDEFYIAPGFANGLQIHEVSIGEAKITSFIRPDIDLEVADKPTHEFPRVDITGFVDKKIEGGLYAYLKASGQVVEAQYPSGGQEPQKGFRGLLDGILQEARQELPASTELVHPSGERPEEIVLAEVAIGADNLVTDPDFETFVLESLKQKAQETYPHHVPTSVETVTTDVFGSDHIVFRLKGVEGALPVYTPLFEGDVNEE